MDGLKSKPSLHEKIRAQIGTDFIFDARLPFLAIFVAELMDHTGADDNQPEPFPEKHTLC